MIRCLNGRARAARHAVAIWRNEAIEAGARQIMIVPAQLTLQAERDCLQALNRAGSFDIQVYSPDRLFRRIFELSGEPGLTRIDEQGRVMLAHMAALKSRDDLKWYQSAVSKPGFAGKLAGQIAAFKQAGLSPDDVSSLSADGDRALDKKLSDLAILYAQYESLLEGRFMDGEDEVREAVSLMGDVGFLDGCRACVYGFDILTPTINSLIIGLNTRAESVDVIIVNEENPDSRDFAAFAPVNRSVNMLYSEAAANGSRCHIETLVEPERPLFARSGGLDFLERELCCLPPKRFAGSVTDVQMAVLPNPEAEAEFAAGVIRRLCRTRGWRYRDFAIALADNSEYSRDAVIRAFAKAGIPLFMATGRPADRHCLSRALLSALLAGCKGWRTGDMVDYLRSGFSGLDDDECDMLINYAVQMNLRGRRWLRPIEDEALESLRKRAITPINDMVVNVEKARDTKGKLKSIFAFLEDIEAYKTLDRQRETLENYSMRAWALEGGQVWNRIIAALDQMCEVLSGENLDLPLIYDCLSRALAETNVKALPQSADAVEAGAVEHLRGKPVKALIITGAVELTSAVSEGLIDENDIARLGDSMPAYMALSGRDITRMQKLNLSSLISLTDEYLLVTRPMSDTAGRALQSGNLMRTMAAIMPNLRLRGVDDAGRLAGVCFEQGRLALSRLPAALKRNDANAIAVKEAIMSIDEYRDGLERVMEAKKYRVYSEKLPDRLIRPAYGTLNSVSVSRLERYAACPFKHFASYALKPQEFRVFELSARDAGVFYHEALEAFMKKYASNLESMTIDQSRASMDEITSRLIDKALNTAFEPGELEKAEARRMRAVARRAADIITRQFDGSRFVPVGLEADIAKGVARVAIDDAELIGRIDRVDVFEGEDSRYVRVVDYKKGSRKVSLPEIYAGLQLQLIMYLATALKRYGGKPAGMFYFSVSDPLIDTDSRDPEVVEGIRRKLLRLDGLALNDPDVVCAMADEPEMSVNVAINKDGSLRKSDSLLTQDDFEYLINRSIENAREMLAGIRDGNTEISPAETQTSRACDWCEYRTLCQFDERIEGANVRPIGVTKGRDVLSIIRSGL